MNDLCSQYEHAPSPTDPLNIINRFGAVRRFVRMNNPELVPPGPVPEVPVRLRIQKLLEATQLYYETTDFDFGEVETIALTTSSYGFRIRFYPGTSYYQHAKIIEIYVRPVLQQNGCIALRNIAKDPNGHPSFLKDIHRSLVDATEGLMPKYTQYLDSIQNKDPVWVELLIQQHYKKWVL